eukprot:363570-Chlamydomonas_euryale.AAC.13
MFAEAVCARLHRGVKEGSMPPADTRIQACTRAGPTWWQMSGRYSAGSLLCFRRKFWWSSQLSSTYAWRMQQRRMLVARLACGIPVACSGILAPGGILWHPTRVQWHQWWNLVAS